MRYSGVRREIAKIRKILNETCGLNYLSVKDANFMLDKICEALAVDEKSNGWIPVRERLPEDEKEYLVTLEKVHGIPEKLYGIANYLKFGDAGYWNEKKYGYLEWDKYSDGHGGTRMYKVIAWTPLPELYKED